MPRQKKNHNLMQRRATKFLRLLKALIWAGLIVWGVAAWWWISQGRQAGRAMEEMLCDCWPRDGTATIGTRQRLLAAAERIGSGDFGQIATVLGPAGPPSAEEQAAARRFLGRRQDARRRMIASAAAAQAAEGEGTDVRPVRDALARALLAAAHQDSSGVERELAIAEAALDAAGSEASTAAAAGSEASTAAAAADSNSVAALLTALAPGFELARDLMTEGYTAADKLLARASWHFRAGEFRQSAALVSLAGRLLAIEPAAAPSAAVPAWFEQLARSPAAEVSAAQSQAAVELCAKMAAAETLAAPLRQVVQRAGREMRAGRLAEAHWWATVALAGLGMSEEEIAAISGAQKP
jgi:hypothetical protein